MKLSELIEGLQKAPGDCEIVNAVIEFARPEAADPLTDLIVHRVEVVLGEPSLVTKLEKKQYLPGELYLPAGWLGGLGYKALSARSEQLNRSDN